MEKHKALANAVPKLTKTLWVQAYLINFIIPNPCRFRQGFLYYPERKGAQQ
jgi:hypothetical protein